MSDIGKLAREIAAKTHSVPQKEQILSGAYDRTPTVKAARLGILEGERRGMEKAAGASFQARVDPWFRGCFPPAVCNDRLERGDRATEEVLEAFQVICRNEGVDFAERGHALVDYVDGRPVGELEQEIGGIMTTVAALCLAHGIDMHVCGETELARISQPEIVEKIRAKQAAKPTGSALPIAQPKEQPNG